MIVRDGFSQEVVIFIGLILYQEALITQDSCLLLLVITINTKQIRCDVDQFAKFVKIGIF